MQNVQSNCPASPDVLTRPQCGTEMNRKDTLFVIFLGVEYANFEVGFGEMFQV